MAQISPRETELNRLSEEEIASTKRYLSKLGVGQVLKIWFGKSELPADLQATIPHLRRVYRNRKSLLEWLHGSSNPVARDLLYVRTSSAEKKRLVGLVVASCKSRFPWINSRIINVMAFRPRYFEKQNVNSRKFPGTPWGALYHRFSLPKGRSRRYLWIPNPPLKRVQKALLQILETPIRRKLHKYCLESISVADSVSGEVKPITIFANAERHLDQKVILSFDIREFFPSTRIADIIIGLQQISEDQPQMVSSRDLPDYLQKSKAICDLNWTQDCQLTVAKLTSFRGRLPQGAPTSPIMADVAFARFDRGIIAKLEGRFPKSSFVYSRYFDDLTISLSSKAVGALLPSELLDQCNSFIEEELHGSSYQLHSGKCRASYTSTGHSVTGLIVRRESVELPRSLKRYLRSVIRHLSNEDFVDASRRWAKINSIEQILFCDSLKCHRWKEGGRVSRVSAERLAVLMLRHFYPDLRIERVLEDWYPWQKVVKSDDNIIRSKSVWRILEWLLSALWNGEISLATMGDENSLTFTQRGVPICRVIAESNHAFFFLDRDTAVGVIRYWHHLRGLSGFLRACPDKPCFQRILSYRDQLSMILASVRIEKDFVSLVKHDSRDEPPPDTIRLRVEESYESVSKEYTEFVRRVGGISEKSVVPSLQAFRTHVNNSEQLKRWIESAYELFTLRLIKFPNGGMAAQDCAVSDLFEYIQLKTESTLGLISPHYKRISEFEKNIGFAKDSPNAYSIWQLHILESLHENFIQTTKRRRELEGTEPGTWQSELLPNKSYGGTEKQYDDEILRFCQLHRQLQSSVDSRRVFVSTGEHEIVARFETLQRRIERSNSDHCWLQLQEFCRVLDLVTREQVDGSWCLEPPPKDKEIRNTVDYKRRRVWDRLQEQVAGDSDVFRLVKHLRNLDSHGAGAERRKEWVSIQVTVGKLLGRSWQSKSGTKHPEFHAHDDLELSPLETEKVRLCIIRKTNEMLTDLCAVSLDKIDF